MAAVKMSDDVYTYGRGWYEEERDDFSRFRWMSESAELALPEGAGSRFRYLILPVFSEFRNFTQVLTVRRGDGICAEIPLLDNWNFYGVPLAPEGAAAAAGPVVLTLSLNKLFPLKYHAADKRHLGVRIGPPELHDDAGLHRDLQAFHANAVLNFRELTEGKAVLESHPVNLGIDLYGKCNISPHCVYCLWDFMKKLEGDNVDIPLDAGTLKAYGPFFTSARTLVNCSFGEPLLHPKLGEILEFCARNKKILEIATNGQAFTDRTVNALAGKPVTLYISLDAATPETYARIRNDRWDGIVPGLRKLGEARRKAGDFPRIYMVFIPMRVNRDDLEEYFKLARIVGADSVVLRPLLFMIEPAIVEVRAGYKFDYLKEMLRRGEVEEVIKKAEEYSRKYGVPVASQFDFGLYKDPETVQTGGAA